MRTIQSRQRLTNVAPHLRELDSDDETFFGESYYSEGEDHEFGSDIEVKEYGSEGETLDKKANLQFGINTSIN